jgi:hypothetical protein
MSAPEQGVGLGWQKKPAGNDTKTVAFVSFRHCVTGWTRDGQAVFMKKSEWEHSYARLSSLTAPADGQAGKPDLLSLAASDSAIYNRRI